MNQTCNQKNCNCGKQHVYKDDLTELVKIDKDKAIGTFEERRDELKKQVQTLEDKRRKPMAHLHLHTFHSILDGAGNIDNYFKLAKEFGHPAMAITDHGTLSGTFEFWKKAKAAGIKPIIGMEAYVNNDMGQYEEKKHEGNNSHQSIFVMNHDGFVNLNKLAYMSFTEGFYRRGRIKTDWLIENKKGLFITTSCAVSLMSKFVKEGKEMEAEEYLKVLMREFGDNLVAELQFNEYDGQKIYNNWLLKMIKKYSLMPILTNDVHYAFQEEAKLQDTLLAINRKEHLATSWKLDTRNLYYTNAEDFHNFNKKFGFNYPEKFIDMCLDNTLKVVEKCNYDFDTKTEKFPKYEATPEIIDYFKTDNAKEIITKLSVGKLKQKIKEYKENKIVIMTPEKEQEYFDRLKYELDVIEEKKALDYFLVYWELIRDYRQKGYTIGPGRGSAAGCLLSWCLEITDIDPIRFDLYFERFMNPTRKSMPDIDVDFMTGTDHITDNFLHEKYGKNRVLSVSTFSTFNEKGCLKDVVRAHMGEEYTGFDSEVHAVTKEMPNFDKVEYSLKDWFINWPKDEACSDVVRRWLTNPGHKTILEETLKFQGQIRGIGQHAAGIVITPGPCWEYLPTNIIASNKNIVTAFQEADKSGKDLSELQILKLDRLKLETLNVIVDAIKLIKEIKGIDVSKLVKNVDLNDPNLYAELRLCMNNGIFQFESAGMGALIRGMGAESFEEVVAANALYRPGPMGIKAHEEYIHNKFHPEEIKYVHPALESILGKTNGVLIFQEQLMFLAHEIGGMSLGEGDMLRRYMDKASSAIMKKSKGEGMSKKEEDNYAEFEKYWNKFLSGAEKNGYKTAEVDIIKDWVIKYLGYSFNRSHSVSYGYLAMQTLFLKHYYPTEFYTALLNHPKTSGGKDKEKAWIAAAIASAMSKGIKILAPSTKSGWSWTMTDEKEISMGFSGINGLGDIAYAELMSFLVTKKKKLDKLSLVEFFELPFSKFNKTAFEACVKAGVFDSWSDSRSFLLSLKEKKRKKIAKNQIALFDMAGEEFDIKMDSNNFNKTTEEEKRIGFMEVCNFDLKKIERIAEIKVGVDKATKRPLENIINFEEEDWYFFILEDFQEQTSKNGKQYFVLTVGDGISNTKLRAFGGLVEKIRPTLSKGSVYVSRFEKQEGKFLNFARNAQFKKLDV
jgi:DNA polymerase-3 subunit alpha